MASLSPRPSGPGESFLFNEGEEGTGRSASQRRRAVACAPVGGSPGWLGMIRSCAGMLDESGEEWLGIERVAQHVCAQVGCSLAMIYSPKEDEPQRLALRWWWAQEDGPGSVDPAPGLDQQRGISGLIAAVHASGRASLSEEAGRALGAGVGRKLTMAMALPMAARRRVLGVLVCAGDRSARWTDRKRDVLEHIGWDLGRALDRERTVAAMEWQIADLALKQERHLGRELHDQMGQELVGLSYLGQLLERLCAQRGQDECAQCARRVSEGLQGVVRQVRSVSRGLLFAELRPNEFRLALEDLVSRTTSDYDVACHLECSLHEPFDDAERTTHLFRIIQEAVRNAIKHAQCRRIDVRVARRSGGRLVLSVSDDGVGLACQDVSTRGLGLRIMRHRAARMGGRLVIEPGQAGGTVVRCDV